MTGEVSDSEWDPETVFDVLGCPLSRRILALADVEPCSAEELVSHCEASKPTVYRRLNALQEYDMLVERHAVDDDGTHYKTYETALEAARFAVDSGSFAVDIELTRDYLDDTSQVTEVAPDATVDGRDR